MTVSRKTETVKLFRKQKGRCHICGGQMTLKRERANTATRDHVIPRSRLPFGYAEKKGNKKAACFQCNNEKGNRMPGETVVPVFF